MSSLYSISSWSSKSYRAELLHESSTKVIALLGTLAEQFNAEHGDDLVSLNDLLDILNTARGRLVKAAQARRPSSSP